MSQNPTSALWELRETSGKFYPLGAYDPLFANRDFNSMYTCVDERNTMKHKKKESLAYKRRSVLDAAAVIVTVGESSNPLAGHTEHL